MTDKTQRRSTNQCRPQKSRKGGRPKKADGPAFPTDEVDQLLVHGEAVDGCQRYPSFREVAQRFSVSHATIAQYAKRHDCVGRRQRAQAEVRDRLDHAVIEQTAEAMVVDKEQMDKLACEFLGAFGKALREGRVRADSFADFNQAVRLVLLLRGEADARQEHVAGITLERLQERHRVWLESVANVPQELTGEIRPVDAAPSANPDPATEDDAASGTQGG